MYKHIKPPSPLLLIIDTAHSLVMFARLSDSVLAHRALLVATGVRSGHPPSNNWKHPRGHPRDSWFKTLTHADTSLQQQWQDVRDRGHRQPTQRLQPDMRS